MKTMVKFLFWLANKLAGHSEEGLITKWAVYWWRKKQSDYVKLMQK